MVQSKVDQGRVKSFTRMDQLIPICASRQAVYLPPAVHPIVAIQQFTDAALAQINWRQLHERRYATDAICHQIGAGQWKWTGPDLVHTGLAVVQNQYLALVIIL